MCEVLDDLTQGYQGSLIAFFITLHKDFLRLHKDFIRLHRDFIRLHKDFIRLHKSSMNPTSGRHLLLLDDDHQHSEINENDEHSSKQKTQFVSVLSEFTSSSHSSSSHSCFLLPGQSSTTLMPTVATQVHIEPLKSTQGSSP